MAQNEKNIITTISYFHVEQDIVHNRKRHHKTIHQLTLCETEVLTTNHHFRIDAVHDMSYRSFSNNNGLLYLHTNQGVFTYNVEANPDQFIRLFHQIKQDKT